MSNNSEFSPNGEYWAQCSNDGKLKIWETSTSRLKQEFTPNLHLSSPCSVLEWLIVGQQAPTTASPWKKRKRKSGVIEDTEQKQIIAMGSVSGKVTLYDLSTASVCSILDNGHTSTITAITWSAISGLFTAGDDHQIIQWNIQDNCLKCKWTSGKVKVTSLETLSDGKSLISAGRTITWWNLDTKQIIGTFTGHATQINLLKSIKIDDNISYLVSGSIGTNYLSVWSLNEPKKNKTPTTSLQLNDDPVSLSVKNYDDNSTITILAANRSGQVNVFNYQPNGQTIKQLNPSLTVIIASDSSSSLSTPTQQQKDSSQVQSIPIQTACLTDDQKLLIAYGKLIDLTFEKLTPDYSDKVQSLIRTDGRKLKDKKDESISKIKAVDTDNAEYVTSGLTTLNKRTKNSTGSQLPLKDRLENLSLNVENINTNGKTPTKVHNMAQLLIQGLNSKDKTILQNVLNNRDERIIKNTIGSLPVQAITPLLKEFHVQFLGTFKIYYQFYLIYRLRERGRVALVTGQISHLNDKENKEFIGDNNSTYVEYKDGSSDEDDSDVGELEADSSSDQTWEENSDVEDQDDLMENGKSDDDDDDDNESIVSD
ncbi:hypothetical protein HCN44_008715 [Aphidius gifuensis]|uniref:WD repeat-containing protein 55 homolog n=1 Tax=Aphidius gifuensis TaxID=684658 RepID=A0A834XNN9_APHGI|nr:hypothetical protein HCN44_008715 [Aphidius gifuensis]